MSNVAHVYFDGQRISPTEVGGYIHVGPEGKTAGPNLDIELALKHGYTVGLTFIPLNDGEIAVIGTDPQATAEATDGDEAFEADGRALMEQVKQTAMDNHPIGRMLKGLMESMGKDQPRMDVPGMDELGRGRNPFAPRMSPFEGLGRRERSGDMSGLMKALGMGEDDCQCPVCKARRGEL